MTGLQWLQDQDTYLKALPQQLVLSSWLIMMMATHHPLKGRLPPRWLANRKVTLALLLRLQLRFNETSNSGSGSRYSLQLTVVVGSVREVLFSDTHHHHCDLQTIRSLWHSGCSICSIRYYYNYCYAATIQRDLTSHVTSTLGHVTVCNSLWWWEVSADLHSSPSLWLANHKVTLALWKITSGIASSCCAGNTCCGFLPGPTSFGWL